MSDKVENLDKPTRDAIKKALAYLEQNRAFWNGPQHRAAYTLLDLIGEDPEKAYRK